MYASIFQPKQGTFRVGFPKHSVFILVDAQGVLYLPRCLFFKKGVFSRYLHDMKKILILCLGMLTACTPGAEKSSKNRGNASPQTLEGVQKVLTKGIPNGFVQRDYVMGRNGKKAYTTFQLPDGSRSFIIEINNESQIPVFVPFTKKYGDLEPMLAPDDQFLLFASNRPLAEGDTSSDYNLWYIDLKAGKEASPQAFDTIINTGMDEYYPSMNSRGDLYFTAVYGDRQFDDIYVSYKTDTGYTAPKMLPFCEGEDRYEFNAFVTADDQHLIFTSYGREGELGGGDLFYASRNAGGEWGDPRPVEGNINSSRLEFSPFLKGDTLFFTSKRIDPAWEKKEFNYLSSVQLLADSVATGLQNVYMARWKPKANR